MVLATSSHHIKLAAEKLPNGQYGYKMLQHRVSNTIGPQDHTALYADIAAIPGPILFAKQGDVVKVELTNNTEVQESSKKTLISLPTTTLFPVNSLIMMEMRRLH